MMGPGKYDDLCTLVRERAGITEDSGGGVVLIIFNGNKGNGFACQTDPEILLLLPDILQNVARQMREEERNGMTFSNGDKCWVTCGERTVEGVVMMISDNQISGFIQFDAMLGGHVGKMPIMAWTSTDAARGLYHSIIDPDVEVTLKKRQES
jgi:hypothetical protein